MTASEKAESIINAIRHANHDQLTIYQEIHCAILQVNAVIEALNTYSPASDEDTRFHTIYSINFYKSVANCLMDKQNQK